MASLGFGGGLSGLGLRASALQEQTLSKMSICVRHCMYMRSEQASQLGKHRR